MSFDFAMIKLIAAVLPIGMVAVDQHGCIKVANSASADLLGSILVNPAGKHVNEILPNSQLTKVMAERKPSVYQISDGLVSVWATGAPILDANGDVFGAIELYEDRRRVDALTAQIENLTDRNHLLETILDTAFEDIAAVNADGLVTYMSRKAATKMGVERRNTLGRPMSEISSDCLMAKVARTGKAQMGELWKVKNASVPVMVLPIVEEGQIKGSVCKSVFRDIQDAKLFVQRFQSSIEIEAKGQRAGTARYSFGDIVGTSPALVRAKELAHKASSGKSTVLLLAESGCGKELFAHAIHSASSFSGGPFVSVNCASIPESLLESELFGYEDGAFTGARKGGRPGKFELAQGGTIFLDEIGDMSPFMQAKLLRVLQEGEIQKLGSRLTQRISVRVIAATNADLGNKVTKNTFREDLYYRLAVIPIRIPPLRNRHGDVNLLIDHMLPRLAARAARTIIALDDEVREYFNSYEWPGNVRELVNILEGAVCLASGPVIAWTDVPPYFAERLKARTKTNSLTPNKENASRNGPDTVKIVMCPIVPAAALGSLQEIEKTAIQNALDATGGNKRQAAMLLGLARSTFYKKAKRHHIEMGGGRFHQDTFIESNKH